MVEKTKQCNKCNKQKLFSGFNKSLSTKDGFQFYCRNCQSNHSKKRYQFHQDKIIEYYRTHKVEISKKQKEYRKTLIASLRIRFHLIKNRCNNPANVGYKNYGGRGIKCLFNSFNEFANYVLNILQIDPRGLTIDRIDNSGHYEPGNIRFVTQAENNKNKRKYKTKRLITLRQEKALRLCHHDFTGLPQTEAAKRMNISQSALSDLLAKVKEVLPDYFPLLTKLESERYHLYMEGWSVEDIAEYLGLTPDSVYKALKRAKDKGACFTEPKGRVLSYSPEMDNNVVHRF